MDLLQESDHKIIGNGKSNKKGGKSKSSDAKILDQKPTLAIVGRPDDLEWQGQVDLEWQGKREESIQLPPPLAPPYHHHR